MRQNAQNLIQLTDEQLNFISLAKEGKNILVDACIGSGKTTSIQILCQELPSNFQILYLTYNRLLKLDAQEKIVSKNTTVTNYHGFAGRYLYRIGVRAGRSDMIQVFLDKRPQLDHYDVMILDEYQDIDREIADLLLYIKQTNPNIQIIAVGDMEQKIYDKTTLDVMSFINNLLGEHAELSFSTCFRLSAPIASKLGRIWNKTIVGVNEHCQVEVMDIDSITTFLTLQNPEDILCLGSRKGKMANVLNQLETICPEKYNKTTVYASINDDDAGTVNPKKENAIFTTFDSSKGLERRICVVFDYSEDYWEVRRNSPLQSYRILRNIFCVAASRGKDRIIFANEGRKILSEETLSKSFDTNERQKNLDISSMFDFKHKESIEKCFSMLKIREISENMDHSPIPIKNHDGLIDLSPCIGMYQEASFFTGFNIDEEIHFLEILEKRALLTPCIQALSLDEKILYVMSVDKKQDRYRTQVQIPFVLEPEKKQLDKRLGSIFTGNEDVQVPCVLKKDSLCVQGLADVVKDQTVYELKFVSELKHEHFLQCACYMVALHLHRGVVWNTRGNEMYEIKIPDEGLFLRAVFQTIKKETVIEVPQEASKKTEKEEKAIGKIKMADEYFAVIDTETNWDDKVMSIGLVIADSQTLQAVDKRYYIITPEYLRGGMYSGVLTLKRIQTQKRYTRDEALRNVKQCLGNYCVQSIFAYNASFDYKHLPELNTFRWYDIMRLAAYKQYNPKISPYADCYSTGKLKRNYSVNDMYRLLTDDMTYHESHNALADAIDELTIMKCLGYKPDEYEAMDIAGNKKTPSKEKTTLDKRAHVSPAVAVKPFASNNPCVEKTEYGINNDNEHNSSSIFCPENKAIHVDDIYREAMGKFSSADISILQEAVEQLRSISDKKLVSQDIKVFQYKINAIKDEENKQVEKEYAQAIELSVSPRISDLRLAIAKLNRINAWKNTDELKKRIEERIANINIENEKQRRISNMLCQYCGGVFGGLFIRKCKKCGRKKDY